MKLILHYGAAALLGAGAVASMAPFGSRPADAQAVGGSTVEIAATTVGNMSHAWAIDMRMGQVIHCRADNGTIRECRSVALPGAAQPQR